jgi:hypothetical protein
MEIRKTLYVTSREEWRAWLAKHYQSETEVWLIYYKKHSGQPRISYDHAVEEALCFGWIDSIVKRIDDEKFAQKFTPRRDGAKWSALNKRRLRKLIREGMGQLPEPRPVVSHALHWVDHARCETGDARASAARSRLALGAKQKLGLK